MKKPYWIKKSYLKYKINNILFSIFQIFIPKNKLGNKVLITELDGIGDIIIRQKLVELIADKYGKENIVILAMNGLDLIDFLGFKYEVFDKNAHYNFIKLIKLFMKLCKYDFSILYSLEFPAENKLDFLNKLMLKEIYAFEGGSIGKWKKENVNTVEKKKGKVLEVLYDYTCKFIKYDIEREEIRPELNMETSDMGYIAVGIGASNKKRIASPEKMAEFLEILIKENPDIKFHMLGYGESDILYFQMLKEKFNSDKNLVCLVNKLSLGETVKQIANAKCFIGFDSGLYNIAYALKKKQICIVSLNGSQDFFHEDKNIKFLYKELNEDSEGKTVNSDYNNDINLILSETFKKVFLELTKTVQ